MGHELRCASYCSALMLVADAQTEVVRTADSGLGGSSDKRGGDVVACHQAMLCAVLRYGDRPHHQLRARRRSDKRRL